ncbi:MAG: TonB family protein [Terriglobales bacterium]
MYHEYVHYLTRRLMSQMPLWLVEGLAKFYGNIRIDGKTAYVGAPSTSNVLLLRQSPLLSLSTLFDVTASSPYYHEENKASIFYAESWALTHYLIAHDWRDKAHRVNDFVTLLGQNVPQAEAARRTIGDPQALQGALNPYIHNFSFSAARLDTPATDESDFQVLPFSEAESLAVRADFMAYDRHYAEAQAMLEEALKLDPKLAAACESMGFLNFQQGKTAEAGKWYSEAVALNSQSYVANFYYAVNLLKGRVDDDSTARAVSSLRAAIKINPNFAPAYNALAYVLAIASPMQNPDEAYLMVIHAVELEPGNVSYRVRAVQVLERLNRAEDAARVANLAVSMARTPQEQAEASTALSGAQQFQAYHNRADEFKKAQASAESSGQTTQTPRPNVGPGLGGAFRVGGGVSPPKAVFAPDPEYSEEARKAKYQGTCVLWLVVGPDGKPRDIKVARTLGLGLDEKAIEAVKQWKFEPAMKDGKPVAVQINIEVSFRLYSSLDGTWEGDLTFLQGALPSQEGPTTVRYRIAIHGSTVHVYTVEPQDVREVKPDKFRIEQLMTNAVIYATDSGKDSEGSWVETLVFTVTQGKGTTLLTNLSRVVNKIDPPGSNDRSKFARLAAGELKFIEPPTTSSEQNQQTPPALVLKPALEAQGSGSAMVGGGLSAITPASSDAALPNALGVDLGSLDGTWEGDLVFVRGATLRYTNSTSRRCRITIQGSEVHVYNVQPQDVREVKPGRFHIERLMTNPVIYATDSGHDNEGTWVETQVLAVTLKNGTALLTNFARVVNNLNLPISSDHSKFAVEAAGEFKLMPANSSEEVQESPSTPQAPLHNPFANSGSGYASDQIAQAARGVAANRVGYGDGHDFGLGQGTQGAPVQGGLQVLSDTEGVDFGPYLERVLHDVKQNWYLLIPDSARAPVMKKGKVGIEFAILKDGHVGGMKLVSSSGDVAFDRAAYGGIANSNPFPPLPMEFHGQYLAVRFGFLYNPDKGDLAGPSAPVGASAPAGTSSPATPTKPGITVRIFPPGVVTVPVGGSEVISVQVEGTTKTGVTWSIKGAGCFGSACGTMQGDLYLAPASLPSPPPVTLKATSEADLFASDSITVNLVAAKDTQK